MKVIAALFNNDLSNPMLLIQSKRINILFYVELFPFIHSFIQACSNSWWLLISDIVDKGTPVRACMTRKGDRSLYLA